MYANTIKLMCEIIERTERVFEAIREENLKLKRSLVLLEALVKKVKANGIIQQSAQSHLAGTVDQRIAKDDKEWLDANRKHST